MCMFQDKTRKAPTRALMRRTISVGVYMAEVGLRVRDKATASSRLFVSSRQEVYKEPHEAVSFPVQWLVEKIYITSSFKSLSFNLYDLEPKLRVRISRILDFLSVLSDFRTW